MDKKDVLKTLKDDDITYVDIRFTDPRGKLQHVTVMADLVDEDFIDEGFMFDGSSIAGWKSIDQSDMKLMLDPSSAYIDPFYAEKTLGHPLQRASSPTPTSPTSATRAAPRSRPRPTSSPPASATPPTWAPRPSSSSSTTSATRSP